ncbi:unnamed protein product [Cuscuta europaea]|uniref:DUF1985 domain-containing protein n=1 Tax=Cuscuta europaea TaxID=41803 RepID=A0A9P0ZK00_CUSEU|nr:unnamed protein product [Cuscuta europaea]
MVRTPLAEMAERALKLRIPSHDYFPAQYSVCSNFRNAAKWVQSSLSATEIEIFHALPWGHLIDIPPTQFSGQVFHMLALHLVQEQPDEELWFAIGGTLYKFTYVDVCRISGLPAGAEPVAAAGDVSGQESGDEAEPVGAIAKKYLGGSVDITHVNLKNKFEKLKLSKRRNQMDAVKLASLFYIECVLLAKDNTTRINASSIRLVNDLEEFKKCPWSLRSYKLLVSHMKGLMDGQPQKFKDRKENNPLSPFNLLYFTQLIIKLHL